MSSLSVLKEAWQNRDKLGDANQSRELAAFLPAALEIQESPPNPLARWMAWSLLVLVIFGIAWAVLGKVNIVASAEGKIIPSSRVKQIQPLQKGVVHAVLVGEGDYVEKGQPLIELDTTLTRADKKRLESEKHSMQMRLMVDKNLFEMLQPTEGSISDGVQLDTLGLQLSEEETQLYTHLLNQQWLQYLSQLQSLKSSLAKNKAEQAATQELIRKLEQTLPIAEQRAEKLKSLKGENFVSEDEYLQVEQERIQQTQDLAAQRQNLKQFKAAEGEVLEQINLHKAQTNSTLLSEMADLKRQIISMEEEVAKATDINNKQVLYAPVAGRVQELAINTVGGVVTDAQQLMLIVPDEEQLEVEVFLENKDIGFVTEDMPAEIKIHTFPFTKYGVINADIINVSDDATVDENKGLIYRMQLAMEKNTLWVEGREVKLQPGMAVTAEVQTGERRIVEFFLAPLLRAKNESIRER